MTKHRVAAWPYNLSRVFATRDRLVRETLLEFLGTELVGDWFDKLVGVLCETLDVDESVMFDSIRNLAGTVFDRPTAYATAWRLAGNIDKLQAGLSVPPWFIQTQEEWLPVQILSWQPDQTARRKPTNTYRMRVLAGSAVPLYTTASWPTGFTRLLARQIGFTKGKGNFPYQHPSEFVQLRLRILADPARSKPGQLGFWEVAGGAGLTKWNREIMAMRARIDFVCPENYTHPCYRCPIGYDQCDAACHKETIYATDEGTTDGASEPSAEPHARSEHAVRQE